jgi:Ribosomal protein S5, N-terminal domain
MTLFTFATFLIRQMFRVNRLFSTVQSAASPVTQARTVSAPSRNRNPDSKNRPFKKDNKPFNKEDKTPLLKRVLSVRNVVRVTGGGKVRSVSALVVVGDQNGSAGYGQGRGADTASAVAKGTLI